MMRNRKEPRRSAFSVKASSKITPEPRLKRLGVRLPLPLRNVVGPRLFAWDAMLPHRIHDVADISACIHIEAPTLLAASLSPASADVARRTRTARRLRAAALSQAP
jgi:hypothetical protein